MTLNAKQRVISQAVVTRDITKAAARDLNPIRSHTGFPTDPPPIFRFGLVLSINHFRITYRGLRKRVDQVQRITFSCCRSEWFRAYARQPRAECRSGKDRPGRPLLQAACDPPPTFRDVPDSVRFEHDFGVSGRWNSQLVFLG